MRAYVPFTGSLHSFSLSAGTDGPVQNTPTIVGQKRPRPRSLVACGACRKRRSKCEPRPDHHGDSEYETCLRCYQLRTECSFLPGTGRAPRRLRWSENSPPPLPSSTWDSVDDTSPTTSLMQPSDAVYRPQDGMSVAATGCRAAGPERPSGLFASGPLSHSTVSPGSHLDSTGTNVANRTKDGTDSETTALRAQVEQLQRELAVLRSSQHSPSAT